MNYTPIIDTGHGFETAGKRSEGFYDENKNVILRENCVNEAVGNKLSFMCWQAQCEYHFITNEWIDVPLQERVNRERAIAKDIKDRGLKSIFLSIHADAFHHKNKAKGGRFFYHSKSGRELAHTFTESLVIQGYGLHLREPMAANFKVIRETSSPALLFEMGFMTTQSDLDVLVKDEFRNHTAQCLFNALNTL